DDILTITNVEIPAGSAFYSLEYAFQLGGGVTKELPVYFYPLDYGIYSDVLVFYTDGLTETTNHKDNPYGDERLAARLARTSHMDARQIRESILADLWTFKGDAEQHDDITLIVVKARADADVEEAAAERLDGSDGPAGSEEE
ncbi:MAG: SpoIIE family protein phosphatase, partial [Acidobacteriota bacterium]